VLPAFIFTTLLPSERPTGNHGRTGQLEPGVGDGVLLEGNLVVENVSFSRSLSVLTFFKAAPFA
jgi:hypothetical protein